MPLLFFSSPPLCLQPLRVFMLFHHHLVGIIHALSLSLHPLLVEYSCCRLLLCSFSLLQQTPTSLHRLPLCTVSFLLLRQWLIHTVNTDVFTGSRRGCTILETLRSVGSRPTRERRPNYATVRWPWVPQLWKLSFAGPLHNFIEAIKSNHHLSPITIHPLLILLTSVFLSIPTIVLLVFLDPGQLFFKGGLLDVMVEVNRMREVNACPWEERNHQFPIRIFIVFRKDVVLVVACKLGPTIV